MFANSLIKTYLMRLRLTLCLIINKVNETAIIEHAKQVVKVYKFDNSPEELNYKLFAVQLVVGNYDFCHVN